MIDALIFRLNITHKSHFFRKSVSENPTIFAKIFVLSMNKYFHWAFGTFYFQDYFSNESGRFGLAVAPTPLPKRFARSTIEFAEQLVPPTTNSPTTSHPFLWRFGVECPLPPTSRLKPFDFSLHRIRWPLACNQPTFNPCHCQSVNTRSKVGLSLSANRSLHLLDASSCLPAIGAHQQHRQNHNSRHHPGSSLVPHRRSYRALLCDKYWQRDPGEAAFFCRCVVLATP